jgi:hypothetical protein
MDTVFQKSRPERSRYFKVGDRVIARDYKGKDHKWIGGQIESSDGPLMYKVKTDLGSTWKRHVDQIKPSKIAEDIAQNTPLIEEPSVKTTENTKTDVLPVVQQEVCNFVAQNLIVLFHRPHTILKSLNEAFD